MAKHITKAQFTKLQKKHKTDARIGATLGVSRQAVHQLRKKLRVSAMTADNDNRNAAIVEAYKLGESGTSIAKRFELSISQTYRVINRERTKNKIAVKKAVNKLVKKTSPIKQASVKKKNLKKKQR